MNDPQSDMCVHIYMSQILEAPTVKFNTVKIIDWITEFYGPRPQQSHV